MNLIKNIIGKALYTALTIMITIIAVQPAQAKIVFKNEFLIEDNGANAFIIDSGDDVTGNLTLQFGNTLAETITFDTTNTWFEFSNDVNFKENKFLPVALNRKYWFTNEFSRNHHYRAQ